MRDRLTRQPRGFGFVTFASPLSADAATSAPHWLDGNRVDAKRSVPHDARPRSKKVFVGGLAPETSAGEGGRVGVGQEGRRTRWKSHEPSLTSLSCIPPPPPLPSPTQTSSKTISSSLAT